MGNAGSEKRNGVPWIAKRAAEFIGQLGHNRLTRRCDNELAIEALKGNSDKLAKKEARLFQRDRQWEKASPMGSLSALWDTLLVRLEH